MSKEDLMVAMAELTDASDARELHERIGIAVRHLGCDHFLIGMQVSFSAGVRLQHVDSGYPDRWQARYAEQRYIVVDPLVGYCQTNTAPVIWNPDLYSEKSQDFMEDSRAHGLAHGLTVPVHEGQSVKSMFCMARDKPFADPREAAQMIATGQVLATCVHMAMSRLVYPALIASRTPQLTVRELACLQYAAQGKGSHATGEILNLDKNTVDYHLSKVIKKLGVSTRIQAVALGVQLRILT